MWSMFENRGKVGKLLMLAKLDTFSVGRFCVNTGPKCKSDAEHWILSLVECPIRTDIIYVKVEFENFMSIQKKAW